MGPRDFTFNTSISAMYWEYLLPPVIGRLRGGAVEETRREEEENEKEREMGRMCIGLFGLRRREEE